MQPRTILEDPRLRETVYVVEATSYEQQALWLEYSNEARAEGWGSPGTRRVTWGQDPSGWSHVVGELAGLPVNVSFRWALICGRRVLFWYACSRVVDSEMCETWLMTHVPAYLDHHTDAQNFVHCLSHVERQRSAAVPSSGQ